MTEPNPPFVDNRAGWTRRRIVFVSLSAAATCIAVWLAGDVLIPFVVAALIAYVLVPPVAFLEDRARFPRSVAIISVYLAVFGLAYLAVAAVAPRIYHDSVRLAREAPATVRAGARVYGPRIEKWAQAYVGGPEPTAPVAEPRATLRAAPQPDGSLSIDLTAPIEVVQEGNGRWILRAVEPAGVHEGFRIAEVITQGTERLLEYFQRNVLELLKVGQRVLAQTARAVFLSFMTLMVAGYLIHTKERVVGFLRSMAPPLHRPGFDLLLIRMDRGLSGVVRGQLLICVVNGVLSAVGFWFLDLKYWPLLALVAGIMSIVPIFGSILSTIPAVLVGLTQDLWTALWVLLWIVFIHQLEANLLNPKIIGVSAKIHPVLVVFSLLVGEHVFGLWGAVLAVPTLSLLQSVFNHFRFSLPESGPDSLLGRPSLVSHPGFAARVSSAPGSPPAGAHGPPGGGDPDE